MHIRNDGKKDDITFALDQDSWGSSVKQCVDVTETSSQKEEKEGPGHVEQAT